jgi:hypothetical protein
MISAALLTITLLGCGDDTNNCEFISQSSKTYESLILCEAAIPALLLENSNAPYPTVTGHCGPVSGSEASAENQPSTLENTNSQIASSELSPAIPAAGTSTGATDPATSNKPLKRVFKRIENGFAYVRTGTSNALTNIAERTRESLKKLAVRLKLRKEPAAQ